MRQGDRQPPGQGSQGDHEKNKAMRNAHSASPLFIWQQSHANKHRGQRQPQQCLACPWCGITLSRVRQCTVQTMHGSKLRTT